MVSVGLAAVAWRRGRERQRSAAGGGGGEGTGGRSGASVAARASVVANWARDVVAAPPRGRSARPDSPRSGRSSRLYRSGGRAFFFARRQAGLTRPTFDPPLPLMRIVSARDLGVPLCESASTRAATDLRVATSFSPSAPLFLNRLFLRPGEGRSPRDRATEGGAWVGGRKGGGAGNKPAAGVGGAEQLRREGAAGAVAKPRSHDDPNQLPLPLTIVQLRPEVDEVVELRHRAAGRGAAEQAFEPPREREQRGHRGQHLVHVGALAASGAVHDHERRAQLGLHFRGGDGADGLHTQVRTLRRRSLEFDRALTTKSGRSVRVCVGCAARRGKGLSGGRRVRDDVQKTSLKFSGSLIWLKSTLTSTSAVADTGRVECGARECDGAALTHALGAPGVDLLTRAPAGVRRWPRCVLHWRKRRAAPSRVSVRLQPPGASLSVTCQ